jgi:hypothetical protein
MNWHLIFVPELWPPDRHQRMKQCSSVSGAYDTQQQSRNKHMLAKRDR